jgi:hypothetical protein
VNGTSSTDEDGIFTAFLPFLNKESKLARSGYRVPFQCLNQLAKFLEIFYEAYAIGNKL